MEDSQKAYEKKLNISYYEEDADQNHNEIPPNLSQNGED